jgi:hypothetical protein
VATIESLLLSSEPLVFVPVPQAESRRMRMSEIGTIFLNIAIPQQSYYSSDTGFMVLKVE